MAELDKFGPVCDPSELTIHQDIAGAGLTADEVRSLIGMPALLSFVDAAKTSFYCLDGRHNNAVLGISHLQKRNHLKIHTIGTMAGDAGEFILALHVYQTFRGTSFTQDAIVIYTLFRCKRIMCFFKTGYLQKYLNYMKHDRFVMCTDDAAVSHLEKELGVIDMLRIIRYILTME